jgi:serine/threonine protein kinase
VIHQADWLCDENPQTVAVKIFKGTLTSDGLPLKEMTACMGAGTHPNLIPLLGKIDQHPAEAHGLVMSLIDASFRNLAGPPSFESCTRDVYPADKRFDLGAVLRIAHGIASAAEHLHAQGIMHGDLYAHNILHCDEGNALLGDFGAASFFAPDERARPRHCSASRCAPLAVCWRNCCSVAMLRSTRSKKALKTLADLQVACTQETIGARPLFAEIGQILSGLKSG